MITADQLICHAVGDYVIQSDWMANEKTKKSIAAIVHALSYAIPFLFLRPSIAAMAVMVVTHFAIDRWRLARYVVYAKNYLSPRTSTKVHYEEIATSAGGVPHFVEKVEIQQWWFPWEKCASTGYVNERPPWLSVWLLIIADNVMHILINGLALRYL